MSIFEQASAFTLDSEFAQMLKQCAKNKFPPSFRLSRGQIITARGHTYPLPTQPMELCNLIHDIVHGTEKVDRPSPPPSKRTAISIRDEAIVGFARREATRLQRDDEYAEKLSSCIFTALYLGKLQPNDLVYERGIIAAIKGIDTSIPEIKR